MNDNICLHHTDLERGAVKTTCPICAVSQHGELTWAVIKATAEGIKAGRRMALQTVADLVLGEGMTMVNNYTLAEQIERLDYDAEGKP